MTARKRSYVFVFLRLGDDEEGECGMKKPKKKNLCKDCNKRYAQELGRCRQCWRLRIEGKPFEPNAFRSSNG